MTQTEKGYVDPQYLAIAAAAARPIFERTVADLRLAAGNSVLDVGCGPGMHTVAMAGIVGSRGRVVGVDHDARMIAAAQERARDAGVGAWVTHQVGDAYALPFDDGAFERTRSERMLQHLLDPARAVAELVRVTAPAGRVVIADSDFGSLSFDGVEASLERRMVAFKAGQSLHNGYSGRTLWRLLRGAGLSDVTVQPVAMHTTVLGVARLILLLDDVEARAEAASAISAADLSAWCEQLAAAERAGNFYVSLTVVVAAGSKVDVS
jgi:SAM-dependent methyltransferase